MEKVILALIAIIGGGVGSLIAPWANWGIEKRKQRLASQRKLIEDTRRMIAEVAKQRGTSGSLTELLERRAEFHAIKGYLNQQVIGEIYGGRTTIVGSTIDAGLSYLADEVTKLERKWKLV